MVASLNDLYLVNNLMESHLLMIFILFLFLTSLLFRYDQLTHPLKDGLMDWRAGFMSAPRCFTYRDGNVLVSEYQRMGTLLDLVNITKNADKAIVEPLALHLTAELLGLIELLHSVRMVHADIKPDNFLVRHTPSTK